ncbi:hypothetical protein F2P45_22120 [Massilia sp. CCM 8733]|uniref:DUF1444 domain-containing protein n=1 Tax=Massilia mucilaginosa TaxID=2609282 RepID=A0ABX0NY57_9BURK|nr:hypothetical protein [Massilia mucilaginosa]NHZ91681.1 hypothetical protein [Massilia mucilaginosa]
MGILDLFGSKLTPAKFATLMTDAARRLGITETIRYDADAFSLAIGADTSRVLNLHNAYNEYCRAGNDERAGVIAAYAAAFVPRSMPATFAAARQALLPILRNRATPDLLRLTQACTNDVGHDAQATLPFSEDAVLMLAYDTEHAVQPITASMLKGWGVSIEECLAVALDNLRERTVSRFDEVVPGVFVSAWNDSYDTSRLLFPDIVHQLNLGADPVMMIPTRGRMIATSGVNLAGMLAMTELAQRYVDEEGRQISALMYRFHKGRAVQHIPEEPVAARLKALQLQSLASDYGGQKQLLDRFHERKGIDIYVASCQLMQAADGSVVTMSVWTEGVATLLPKTSMVVLNRVVADGEPVEPIAVAWDELMNKTGSLKLLDASYPPRYRTIGFPPGAVLDTLVLIAL